MAQHSDESGKTIPCLIIGGAAWYVQQYYLGPVMVRGDVQVLPAIACAFYVLASIKVMGNMAAGISGSIDWKRKTQCKQNKGNARFIKNLSELGGDFIRHPHPALYLGVHRKHRFAAKHAVWANTASNAVCVGTSGSGKGVSVILPNLCAINSSFVAIDPKGTNAAMMKAYLIGKGFDVYIINVGGVAHITDIHPQTDSLNPLDMVRNGFYTPGCLSDLVSDASELSHQILPEPASDGTDPYWRNGARDFIVIICIFVVIIKGKSATIGDILQSLSDKNRLIKDMLWLGDAMTDSDQQRIPGLALEQLDWVQYHPADDVTNFIAYIRKKALGTAQLIGAKDNKTADSFISAAKLVLEPFNITSKPFKAMKESTFDPRILKDDPDRPVAVFIVTDNSRPETQMPAAGLILWTVMTALKRHKNKHVPTYIIADETTNFKINGLPEMQTWIREYGVRWIGVVQSLDAYKELYGDSGLKTMLSETEIKIFLPGIREQETLQLLEAMLGSASFMASSHNKNSHQDGHGKNASEDSKPLMTADDIRRCKQAIVFIRGHRPLLVDMPSIASIHPWRSHIGDNPFYKGKYRLPIKVRIRERKGTLTQRLRRKIKAYSKPT